MTATERLLHSSMIMVLPTSSWHVTAGTGTLAGELTEADAGMATATDATRPITIAATRTSVFIWTSAYRPLTIGKPEREPAPAKAR
ncbi:MAG TPA: hypothetical protein VFQ44_05855 [Streptosporangiaceae bacterium]|nr:hypothetical protein [Streptosporangiaceae bacterium]